MCKQNKNVNLLSTMHNSPGTDATEKKKPLVVHFYNQNKVGVDVFHQMARNYTTHAATRRWLLAVWTNLLDIAALNCWILYRKCSDSLISRQNFILQLIESLRDAYMVKRKPVLQRRVDPGSEPQSGKQENVLDKIVKTIQLRFAATVAGQLVECAVMATGSSRNVKTADRKSINTSFAINILNPFVFLH